MSDQNCKGCRWYHWPAVSTLPDHGLCRRNAPIGQGFPMVPESFVCGQYEVKPYDGDRKCPCAPCSERRALEAWFLESLMPVIRRAIECEKTA